MGQHVENMLIESQGCIRTEGKSTAGIVDLKHI
jgi:hypothetical protein